MDDQNITQTPPAAPVTQTQETTPPANKMPETLGPMM